MAHMLDHFGAALLEPWTRLQAPPLTPQLRERMVAGCLREADGRSVAELGRRRDEFLAELLGLVDRFSIGPAPGTEPEVAATAEPGAAARGEPEVAAGRTPPRSASRARSIDTANTAP
jgi:hypothetical protein